MNLSQLTNDRVRTETSSRKPGKVAPMTVRTGVRAGGVGTYQAY